MTGKNYDVVILTHAPKDDVILSIEKLLIQSIKPSKIVIYNTCESIFYSKICNVGRFKELTNLNNVRVVHISEDEFDHGRTRNDASKLCESNYILFLTDDAIPYDEHMCEEMLNLFDKYSTVNSKVAVVYARQLAKSDAKLKERYVREFNYPDYDIIKEKSKEEELGIKNYYCSNVCAMYDRDIFNSLGCFEEDIILNEDTFYVYNAINKGYRVAYSSKAKVLHSHNLSFKEQFSRNFDIGVSQYERKEIFSKIPSTKEGKKMVLNVSKRLLGGFHLIMFMDFMIECFYRYMGFNKGKRFESLSLDDCIKYASNKNYFIKKKRKL
ncbi:MAG: glycosyltransferase family 2 protein [Lachnospiraceae bacterium]|nr:glycosyltransferase family 2 protein [Lachnospiraceae bacterium]